jgi:MFS family permease
MTFWSLRAAACGLARNFTELFIGRMAVGVGEASLAPSAVSLISDLFPADRVATPMGVYSAGYFLGSGLALGIGGLVVGLFAGQDSVIFPIVGAVSSWQAVFLVTGLPGAAVAFLAFAMHDPRRSRSPVRSNGESTLSFTGLFRVRGGLLVRCFLGFSLASLLSYAVTSWTPAFLERRFDLRPQDIGWSFGLAVAFSGTVGALGGGMLLDRIYHRGRTGAYMLVPAIAALIALPLMTSAFFMGSPAAVLTLLALGMCAIGTTAAASYATWRKIAPPELRGRITATFVLCTGLIGGGLGPVSVGLVGDYILADEARLGKAIAIVVAVVLTVMSALFLLNRRAMSALPES